jgi:hypothetical protein
MACFAGRILEPYPLSEALACRMRALPHRWSDSLITAIGFSDHNELVDLMV